MSTLKCKMCGGTLQYEEGKTVVECEYCGSINTLPNIGDEKRLQMFDRANRLRSSCDFEKASGVYESIVAEYPEEAEAYWGLVLCKYGIEYVDDPSTGKKVPTCHRSSFDKVLTDSNFELVMEYCDSVSRGVYRDEAKKIEDLRKGIVEISSKEEPYDVFICYKETDDNGNRTVDSTIAQDVYDALVAKNYKVFFSRITLEDKLGVEYEPYIFAALNSAKVMLVFGTSYDNFNAVWVKNEWTRFLKLMEKDKSRYLIPCFKDIDAYDIPEEFSKFQAQDMSKIGAIQDLVRGVEKLVPHGGSKTVVSDVNYEAIDMLIRDKQVREEKLENRKNKLKKWTVISLLSVLIIAVLAIIFVVCARTYNQKSRISSVYGERLVFYFDLENLTALTDVFDHVHSVMINDDHTCIVDGKSCSWAWDGSRIKIDNDGVECLLYFQEFNQSLLNNSEGSYVLNVQGDEARESLEAMRKCLDETGVDKRYGRDLTFYGTDVYSSEPVIMRFYKDGTGVYNGIEFDWIPYLEEGRLLLNVEDNVYTVKLYKEGDSSMCDTLFTDSGQYRCYDIE